MKKKFLILLLLFWVASNLSYAQDEDIYGKNSYIPVFADADTAVWYQARDAFGFTFKVCVGRDSVFFSNGNYYREFGSDPTGFNALPYCREDTIAQKVYVYVTSTYESTLYDFTLEPGDTWGPGRIVSTVEYLLIEGKYRKVIKFGGEPKIIWVEGIGSLAGIDRPTEWSSFENMYIYALNCFYKDDVLQFKHSFVPDDKCHLFLMVGIDDKEQDRKVTLQPNPVTNVSELTFSNPECQTIKLQIYNLQGGLVFNETTQTETFTIEKDNFVSGLFLYRLLFEDGNSASGKFIVE